MMMTMMITKIRTTNMILKMMMMKALMRSTKIKKSTFLISRILKRKNQSLINVLKKKYI